MTESPFANSYLLPSEYLRFENVANPGRKTGVWRVRSVRANVELGEIRWHGAWRQYVFFPASETLFNVGCLDVLADRIATCNRWQRNVRENVKRAAQSAALPEGSVGDTKP